MESQVNKKSDADFPNRIVCLSYDVVKTICALGCSEKIAGCPSGAGAGKPGMENAQDIGGFANQDFDKIVQTGPDIVIGYSEISSKIMSLLINHGTSVLVLQHASLEETYRAIILLGKICGKTAEAITLNNTMRDEFRKISTGRQEQSHRPIVYFEEWDKPYVYGMKWVSEVIAIAGGIDGFTHRGHSRKFTERVVTTEEVAAMAPDIILASWCGKPVDIDSIKRRPGWEAIPAVSRGHIYEVPGEIILQPGTALVEGAKYISKIINQFNE